MRRFAVLVVAVVCAIPAFWSATHVRADDAAQPTYEEILPPDPSARRPVRGVEVRFVLPFPAYARPLCPRGTPCILGIGGGVGVYLERRFQGGFALGGGYELGLHSAEAVYELTTLHSLGFRGRFVLRPEAGGHPVIELGFGAVGLGDVFRISTFGPYADVGFGGELEMTDSLSFTIGLRVRAMAFVPFTTQRDGFERSTSPYLDAIVAVHAGIAWIAARAEGR